MVATADALGVLYPNSLPLVDWVVVDDGTGEQITFWNPELGPEPTQAELDAVTPQDVEQAKKDKEPDIYDFTDRVPQMIADHDAYLALSAPTQNQKDRQIRDLTQNQKRIIKTVDRILRDKV